MKSFWTFQIAHQVAIVMALTPCKVLQEELVRRLGDILSPFNQSIIWDSMRNNFKGGRKPSSLSMISMRNGMFNSFVMAFT